MSELKYPKLSLQDEKVKKYAAKVLNETEETRKSAIEEMKKWAAENPELHLRTDETHLLTFLRNCKYNVEKTKEKMKTYYILKRDSPEWFSCRNIFDPEIQNIIRMGYQLSLKKLDKNRLVFISRVPNNVNPDLLIKTSIMTAYTAIAEEELAQIYGVTLIIDLTDTGLGIVRQIGISKIRQVMKLWQNSLLRPQKIYFVNVPFYTSAFLNFFITFMPKKLKERVCILQNRDLSKLMEEDILPPEYGGCGETIEEISCYWLDKLISYNTWFIEDENEFTPE